MAAALRDAAAPEGAPSLLSPRLSAERVALNSLGSERPPPPSAPHPLEEERLTRTIRIRGATATQLRRPTALRAALALCGEIAQLAPSDDGVVVEFERHDAPASAPPGAMVRDTSSASVLSEPPAMASRRVTIAPPDGSGGGASAGGGGDDGVGALPTTTYNERDPSLRKDSGKLRRMSVQTGGFSAPKAPAIPAKERLAKLMVVSPEVLRELSGGALTPATLVAEPKHLVSVPQARERSLRATATNIDSLDIVRRLWRALDLCEREAEEGELNDAAAAAAAAAAATSALSEGSASAAAVTPLSGSRAKSSPASNGSTPKASPASSTAGTPKASMSASMSESKSEGVRWAGGGEPSRFLWPLRHRLRQLDDEEAPFESERRRKRREASDVVAARAALMRAHEIHLDSISTPQRDARARRPTRARAPAGAARRARRRVARGARVRVWEPRERRRDRRPARRLPYMDLRHGRRVGGRARVFGG